jgi:hypothetical protein
MMRKRSRWTNIEDYRQKTRRHGREARRSGRRERGNRNEEDPE